MQDLRNYHISRSATAWRGRAARLLVSAAMASGGASTAAIGAEGGASFYLPGINGPSSGFLPPPGTYFDSTTYVYNGQIGANRQLVIGGNVVARVKVDIKAEFATGLWVTPAEIFGGHLAFSVTQPFGEPDVRAGAIVSGPILNRLIGRPISLGVSDATFNAGDPILSSFIGWHSGNWHWKLGAAVNVPAGAYEPGQLSNLALNRYVGDFSGAVTYLDQERGIDVSGAAGFTVNGENPATRYRTGEEFHADLSVTKYLTKALSVGVLASHYQQLTGDSGPGARLGPFKGRDTAIGGTLGYTFTVGQTPVSTRIKVLREVDVENRFKGTIGFVQLSFPLWVQPPPASAARPVAARY